MIHPIQQRDIEIEHLTDRLTKMSLEIIRMKDFMLSQKFQQDTTIQTGDVMNMLSTILSNDIDREFEPWGWSCDVNREREWRINGNKNFIFDRWNW